MQVSFHRFRPGFGPERFVFVDPDTKRAFSAPTKKALLQHVTSYRAQNELPAIDYLPFIVDNFLCSLPENMGKCTPMKLDRNFGTTIKGGVTLLWKTLTRSFVSDAEANRRGRICVACPYNIFPDRGPFIKWADDVAAQMVGKRKSTYHDKLGNCEVCSCPLRSKVFIAGPFDPTPEEQEKMKSVQCWQLEESRDLKK